MSGFGQHAHNYDIKLFQKPFYRKAGGQDPIKTFVQTSGMQYVRNADAVRDMRFRQANEFNADMAIRNEREDMISKAFYNNKANTDLGGLRGRLGLQLSRTGGALAKGQNKVIGSIERDPTKQETKAAKKIQDAFKKKESSTLQQSNPAFKRLPLPSRAKTPVSDPPLSHFDFDLFGDLDFENFSVTNTTTPAGTGAGLPSPNPVGGAYAMPGKGTKKRATATATATNLLKPHSKVHATTVPTATATNLTHHAPGALKTPTRPGGKLRGGKFGKHIYDSIRKSLDLTKGNTVSPGKGPPMKRKVVPAGERDTPKTNRLNRKLIRQENKNKE